MSSISVSISDSIRSKVDISEIYTNYTKAGNPSSYGIDLEFSELSLYKSLKSSDLRVLECKVESTLSSWAKAYGREVTKRKQAKRSKNVEQMNADATSQRAALENILGHTLSIDDTVEWNSIKRRENFRINPRDLINPLPPSFEIFSFAKDGKPTGFSKVEPGQEPTYEQVRLDHGFFTRLFRKRLVDGDFQKKKEAWEENVHKCQKFNSEQEEQFEKLQMSFEEKKATFDSEKTADNEAIDDLRLRYENGDPKAIEEYCDIVLSSSIYPDGIPRNWDLEYREANKLLVVQIDLPAPDSMPEIESYRYVKSRDEVTEKRLADGVRKNLYDSVIYQICLRTIHEVLEADVINAIDAVAFNGVVTSRNPATGVLESKIILSVSADRDSFLAMDLANVDPKASFRHLKGVSAANLHGLTPIPPVVQLDREDKRIIEGRSVDVDESLNLAAMHWDDFEHLIRGLFEKEFAASNGEVKVTQASADGGVDAIAFDPDPVRGGKIVIQAKRYTNIVGVAAVRDLYGTIVNEGATKGILVTTSDYGRDSYEFAKGKPITLLNGGNLLSLLEKHGQKARINIAEAKKILGAESNKSVT